MAAYTIPAQTRIGHIHLKVADLKRAMAFYCDLLGFELITMYGDQAAFISAGGYHHHIGLILYPTRHDLAVALQRLIDAKYPITGASDHGVSEAIYLNDPDQNGVELYWDRPREQWPQTPEGNLEMYTRPLDLNGLLATQQQQQQQQ
jgi:catechol 2,3-dioxygenase